MKRSLWIKRIMAITVVFAMFYKIISAWRNSARLNDELLYKDLWRKFTPSCEGESCKAYLMCKAGYRIVNSNHPEPCIAIKKRFETKITPPEEQTVVQQINTMIAEVASPAR